MAGKRKKHRNTRDLTATRFLRQRLSFTKHSGKHQTSGKSRKHTRFEDHSYCDSSSSRTATLDSEAAYSLPSTISSLSSSSSSSSSHNHSSSPTFDRKTDSTHCKIHSTKGHNHIRKRKPGELGSTSCSHRDYRTYSVTDEPGCVKTWDSSKPRGRSVRTIDYRDSKRRRLSRSSSRRRLTKTHRDSKDIPTSSKSNCYSRHSNRDRSISADLRTQIATGASMSKTRRERHRSTTLVVTDSLPSKNSPNSLSPVAGTSSGVCCHDVRSHDFTSSQPLYAIPAAGEDGRQYLHPSLPYTISVTPTTNCLAMIPKDAKEIHIQPHPVQEPDPSLHISTGTTTSLYLINKTGYIPNPYATADERSGVRMKTLDHDGYAVREVSTSSTSLPSKSCDPKVTLPRPTQICLNVHKDTSSIPNTHYDLSSTDPVDLRINIPESVQHQHQKQSQHPSFVSYPLDRINTSDLLTSVLANMDPNQVNISAQSNSHPGPNSITTRGSEGHLSRPPTATTPVSHRLREDHSSTTETTNITLLQNSTTPFVITPLAATSNSSINHVSSIQQILTPINMARLIALNQTSHTSNPVTNSVNANNFNSTPQPFKLISSSSSVQLTNCLTSILPHSNVPIPNRYASISSTSYDVHSNSGPKFGLYCRNPSSSTTDWTGRIQTSSGGGSSSSGRRSPHADAINQRISQLQQSQRDRSLQLIVLQDINQILLMDFEENLVNLNVHGLVNCILEILESDDEQLVELKNLSCNVLTHMMNVLPRSSDAVIPALPILLTTMSSSFVGDILERIINLLEQLSRRHGKEVLQSGGVSSVLGFYDFVTSAQHRTILTMVCNCFANLQPSDFDLVADCLPGLAERLKESEPRCVERVCSCFARLINNYRFEPQILKRIVTSCNFLSNLQSLLIISPPVLSGLHDVLQMLATICSNCPELAVDLIKQNIAGTLHCILVGSTIDCQANHQLLMAPIEGAFIEPNSSQWTSSIRKRHRARSQSHGRTSTSSSSSRHGSLIGSGPDPHPDATLSSLGWHPLMISHSPLSLNLGPGILSGSSLHHFSPEDVHAIVLLISELLPPITFQPQQPTDATGSVPSETTSIGNLQSSCRSKGSNSTLISSQDPEVVTSFWDRHDSNVSSSSPSLNNMFQYSLESVCCPSHLSLDFMDPRARLLYDECEKLESILRPFPSNVPSSVVVKASIIAPSTTPMTQIKPDPSCSNSGRRRSTGRNALAKISSDKSNSMESGSSASGQVVEKSVIEMDSTHGMQLVQTLLPLLFEVYAETTRLQTRLLCLEAIQRMIFYSSPILLAKVLHPRSICSQLAGAMNSPERRITLAALRIALMLVDRVPFLFATYFRKEGIMHQVDQLLSDLRFCVETSPIPTSTNELCSMNPGVRCHLKHLPTKTCKSAAEQDVQSLGQFGIHTEQGQSDSQKQPITECPPRFPVWVNSCDPVTSHPEETTNPIVCQIPTEPTMPPVCQRQSSDASNPESFDLNSNMKPTCVKQNISVLRPNSYPIMNNRDSIILMVTTLCFRLKASVDKILKSPDYKVSSSPSNRSDAMDLMPTLKSITQDLLSNNPDSWFQSLKKLTELFKLHRSSSNEPPSPFELHESGVTEALLQFLTKPENRDIRLWIMYRIFLGPRASSVVRLPCPSNLEFLSGKKSTGNKTWLQYHPASYDLFDSTKMDLLLSTYPSIGAPPTNNDKDSSPDLAAFGSLIECLITYLHRQEHFHVHSIPSVLPSDCKWLPYLKPVIPGPNGSNLKNEVPSTSSLINSSRASTSHPADQSDRKRTSSTKSSYASGSSNRLTTKTHSQRLQTNSRGLLGRCSSMCMPSTTITANHNSTLLELDPSTVVSNTNSKTSNLTSPVPGLLRIELQRLTDSGDSKCTDATSSATSATKTTRTPSLSFRSGRKSSLISASSNYSGTSGFGSSDHSVSSTSLRITALATVQNLERLLLQRNYISALLHESGWSQANDHGLTSIAETFIDKIPDDRICRSPLAHVMSDVTDDDEDADHANRIISAKDLSVFSHHDHLRKRSEMQSTTKFQRSHDSSHSGRKSSLPDRRHKAQPIMRDQPMNRASTNLAQVIYQANLSIPHEKDVKLGEIMKQSNVSHPITAESSYADHPLILNPNAFVMSPIPDVRFSPPDLHNPPTQRGVRTTLQSSSETIPSTTRGTTEKSVTSYRYHNTPNSDEHCKTESRSLRRRSIASLSVQNASSELPSSVLPCAEVPSTSILHTLRSTTRMVTSLDGSRSNESRTSTRRKQKHSSSTKNMTDNNDESTLVSNTRKANHLNPSSSTSSRHRRLKGSSLLAAFGMLSNFSSEGSTHKLSRHGRQSLDHEDRSLHHRSFLTTSPSSISSSTSNSSMSPFSVDDYPGPSSKVKPILHFYIGGHRLPADIPLFEAIRKFSLELSQQLDTLTSNLSSASPTSPTTMTPRTGLSDQEVEELVGHLIWNMTHVIHYRLVQSSSSDTDTTPSTSHRRSTIASFISTNHTSNSSKSPDSNPSSPVFATSSLTTAITCLKRRRPEEFESAPSDLSELTTNRNSNSNKTDPLRQSLDQSQHPLSENLVPYLPSGFLTDIRCQCCGMNNGASDSSKPSDTSTLSFSKPLSVSGFLSIGHEISTIGTNQSLMSTLSLLRVLHSISRFWYTAHNVLDPLPLYSSLAFRSTKLAIKANRQLQDAFSIFAGNLPPWLIQLISVCPFLFPFETRRTFFYVYNFDRNRALLRFQDTSSNSLSETDSHRDNSNLRNQTNLLSNMIIDSPSSTSSSVQTSSTKYATNSQLASGSYSTTNTARSPSSFDVLETSSHPSSTFADHVGRSHPLGPRGGRFHLRLALSPNFRRHKVTMTRDERQLLKQAEATLNEMGDSRDILEIAFEDEVGFGLGPTLEFYTIISRLMTKTSLNLWHGFDSTDEGYLISPTPGLYPRPLAKQTKSAILREVCSKFSFLGRLMARALLDGRRLDLPFSPAFFKWFAASNASEAIQTGRILPNDLALIDPYLARHVTHLSELDNRRQLLSQQIAQLDSMLPSTGSSSAGYGSALGSNYVRIQKLESLRSNLLQLDSEVDDLCLNFVLPGYEIELIKNGSHVSVTGSNLGAYLRLIAHWLTIEGVSRQMDALLEGFDSVLPNIRSRLATLFQPDEMENLFCGGSESRFETLLADPNVKDYKSRMLAGLSQSGDSTTAMNGNSEGWDVQTLTQACRCDHGYTPQSRAIRFLFEIMSEFNTNQRRLFVQFITGSPRLPVGGFRALKPPLKIVMKRETGENADNHLPSVMTCQNYLKLPDYSSKELMYSKLMYAIQEGQNAFHLS